MGGYQRILWTPPQIYGSKRKIKKKMLFSYKGFARTTSSLSLSLSPYNLQNEMSEDGLSGKVAIMTSSIVRLKMYSFICIYSRIRILISDYILDSVGAQTPQITIHLSHLILTPIIIFFTLHLIRYNSSIILAVLLTAGLIPTFDVESNYYLIE